MIGDSDGRGEEGRGGGVLRGWGERGGERGRGGSVAVLREVGKGGGKRSVGKEEEEEEEEVT